MRVCRNGHALSLCVWVMNNLSPCEVPAFELHGVVVDCETQKPLGDAAVCAAAGATTVTGKDGSFAVTCEQSPAILVARKEGHVTCAFEVRGLTGSGNDALTLPLARRRSLLGRVIDAERGVALPHARVIVHDIAGMSCGAAWSDADGCFSIEVERCTARIRPGMSHAKILATPVLSWKVEVAGYHDVYPEDVREIRLGELCRDERLLVAVEPLDSVTGMVVDAEKRPVAAAEVAWCSHILKGLLSYQMTSQKVLSDERGRFAWTGPRSTFRTLVMARKPGVGIGWVSRGRSDSLQDGPLVVRLRAVGTLSGTALHGEGGVAGVWINLVPAVAGEKWCFAAGRLLPLLLGTGEPWKAQTQQDGSFSIREIPAGKYLVTVLDEGLVPAPGTEEFLDIKGERRWDFRMVAGRTVKVKVCDGSGTAISGAQVMLEAMRNTVLSGVLGKDKVREAWSPTVCKIRRAEDGEFIVENVPLRWPLRVCALARGYRRAFREIGAELESVVVALTEKTAVPRQGTGDKVPLDFVFTCQGCVVDLEPFQVVLFRPGSNEMVKRHPGEARRGKLTIGDAPAGVFDITMTPWAYEAVTLSSVVVPHTGAVEVSLRPSQPVWVRIEDYDNALSRVSAVGEDEREMGRWVVEDDGVFLVRGLGPGEYRLRGTGPEKETYLSPDPIIFPCREAPVVEFRREK